jgi:hypothetical protein
MESARVPTGSFDRLRVQANWGVLAWVAAGVVLTAVLSPERLRDMERVYVEDESVAPEATPA